jgi:hypothetical protein
LGADDVGVDDEPAEQLTPDFAGMRPRRCAEVHPTSARDGGALWTPLRRNSPYGCL